MAINTREKRQSAGSTMWVFSPPNVTPNAATDAEWRQQSGWSYSGIVIGIITIKRRFNPLGIEYETILEDVTPDDDNNLAFTGILYIGGDGDVKVTGVNGGTVTLVGIPSGTWLNFIRVKKVFATGTTATNIVLAR